MPLDQKKVLVVFGATGVQGGSVTRAILNDPIAREEFHVRAVTRDPSKPAAIALAETGAEIIQANLEDKEALRIALKGAYAVYAVTTFFETFDFAAETKQGQNVADIAKELDVKHLIWSGLPNVSKITNNKLTRVLHFDSKARVTDYIRSLGIPHTIVHIGTYSKIVIDALAHLSPESRSYGMFWPEPTNETTRLPIIDEYIDIGKFIKAILLKPEQSLGRQLNLAEKWYTIQELVTIMRDLSLDVVFQSLDQETFKKGLTLKGVPDIFQEDLVQVMQYVNGYNLFGGGDIEESHQIVGGRLSSFREALERSPDFKKLLE
ncbi:nmrA family transcriptional regulator [Talaromyces proteolyticus]|uniref:NmrA family transcriptional regulator n=1 Tax=Talaromyces proteolyticus TaxID=1131652 RepID=A0AAD4KCZ9_9EURO|nr:nmrA family transcriptional regulator [Talaromyces proteolyticus]KAH8688719.1 nmrA family transcriptional regulator [Talaromyces proteolyticus]